MKILFFVLLVRVCVRARVQRSFYPHAREMFFFLGFFFLKKEMDEICNL